MTQDTSIKFIELNNYLRIIGIVNTGGLAKLLIRAGSVKVNNEIETRNKRKLHAGDVVEYLEKKYVIEESWLR